MPVKPLGGIRLLRRRDLWIALYKLYIFFANTHRGPDALIEKKLLARKKIAKIGSFKGKEGKYFVKRCCLRLHCGLPTVLRVVHCLKKAGCHLHKMQNYLM